MSLKSIIAAVSSLFLVALSSQARAADATAMVYWAEWCSACKILDPVLEEAVNTYDNGEIDIVRLDYTNMTYESLLVEAQKAEALGVADKVALNDVKTGYAVIVVDGEFRGRVGAGMSVALMHQAFDAALQLD
ncbi:thioredoxin domain-containing protein [Parvularcula sp. IMCC14364]|uniref:thioredoxin domain-containing protein n=1 Tax=Parvularcula sp. IMCC14364 TaxID=3067902 RepID=UPI00274250E2|nr:thioredoxin domain-containing protein [Parvularcula sp. IMCC14364]